MEGTTQVPKASSSLAKTLGHRNFDAEKYAQSISCQSDGDKDLQEHKHRVQSLGDETAQILKKQVYKYYQQFIETAKEISYLEGEMFQLNHILTEQMNLMDSMSNIFSAKKKEVSEEEEKKRQAADKKEEQRKVMSSLLEKVEGCTTIADVPSRFLVHDGDVAELDMDSFKQIRKVHLFLFNDSLMVTTMAANRRGQSVPGKYKHECLFDIETLAVINARDAGPVKNAFKFLMFPDSKMFQCENGKEKREWLDVIDETKKKYLKDKELGKHQQEPPTSPPFSPDPSSGNPFVDDRFGKNKDQGSNMYDTRLEETWLLEMPEDLDVFIAQRYFEQAVDLVLKSKAFLLQISDSPVKKDAENKLDARTAQLVSVLTKELQSTPDRSHRGGPRAARRPVMLLIRLCESTKACQLFLQNRTSAVAYAIRQLRAEGSLPLYIGKLCKVFFSNMKETLKEFDSAFKDHSGCYSTFVTWSEGEIQRFITMVSQQVFASKADISEMAECIQIVQSHSRNMQVLGLEFNFLVTSLLSSDMQSAMTDHKQKVIDATRLRSSEEIWNVMNLGTPQGLEKMQDEMAAFGIINIAQYSFDKCFCYLTTSTLSFTRAIITHVDSVIKMYLPELQKLLLDGVEGIEHSYADFVAGCLRSEQGNPEKARLIKRNAMFIAETLFPLIENKIQKCISHLPKQLTDLRRDFIKQTSS